MRLLIAALALTGAACVPTVQEAPPAQIILGECAGTEYPVEQWTAYMACERAQRPVRNLP